MHPAIIRLAFPELDLYTKFPVPVFMSNNEKWFSYLAQNN